MKYDPNKTFFTSDIHFDHVNIIAYCNRPYNSIEDMNEDIVNRWNARVPKDGTVFVLGDVSFAKDHDKTRFYLSRLNGTKHLIRGNHDYHVPNEAWEIDFVSVQDLHEIQVGKSKKIVMCHYPMESWNGSHRGSWHLYGHMHGSKPDPVDSLKIDVGVDTNGMNPYTWDEVVAKMAVKKPILIPKGRNL